MSETTPLESRLVELEIKASYTEDLLDQLNLALYRQQEQIDLLLAEVRRLRQQMPQDAAGAGTRSARDEIPPHY